VYLNDIYQYPSPVEASILQVQILRQNDSYRVLPVIYPVLNSNGIFKDKLFVTLLYASDYFVFILVIVFDISEQNSFRREI